jgi:2,3-dihydroxy-p-cumate/2,3-dihydroxybenzoate 3,4-dioxygenase
MIRHVVLFEFRKDVSASEIERVLAGLRDFPSRYPAMRRFHVGKNISRRDRTFSYAMTVEFDSIEDLEAYLGSEYHEHFVNECFRPNIERRAIATVECEFP